MKEHAHKHAHEEFTKREFRKFKIQMPFHPIHELRMNDVGNLSDETLFQFTPMGMPGVGNQKTSHPYCLLWNIFYSIRFMNLFVSYSIF